ncbi:histone-lysine N-methyltransferase SETMAR-like [Wyeomyia smithii]|uniref:histone-lysine N-methyltransferase SETMAR-like n=1 Tax=Wyeomyia smithii TaxID=174621 RepID=UPI002467FDBE|nr:histone-lysine N-methyltransferase SETMAR-like [Wyeomyia smithii]
MKIREHPANEMNITNWDESAPPSGGMMKSTVRQADVATEKGCKPPGMATVAGPRESKLTDVLLYELAVEDTSRTGRQIVKETDKILEIIQVDRHVSIRLMVQELGIDHKTVWNYLQKIGFQKKLDVWVPHELTHKNLLDRINSCDALQKRNELDPFMKRMVTGDKKWITYDNHMRKKKSWSNCAEPAQIIAKPGLTVRKVLLCVWWDWKEIIHYELLDYGQTLNSVLDCEQLDRLKQAIDHKRPELVNRNGVVFHQDNARPHTSFMTRQKLRDLEWDILSHPPYIPDLAPSDYLLFQTMQNALGDLISE